MSQNDTDLVKRAISGDEEAFRRLVERYRTVAYALAYNIIGDFGHAEDLAQNAMIAAYNSLPKLKDPAKFPSWLNGIVSHLSIDYLRKLQRRPLELRDMTDRPQQEASPATDDRLAAVRRRIAQLEPELREAVTLKYFSELSYREIGDLMGVPASTVRGYLARGMDALRQATETVDPAEEGERE